MKLEYWKNKDGTSEHFYNILFDKEMKIRGKRPDRSGVMYTPGVVCIWFPFSLQFISCYFLQLEYLSIVL